MKLTIPEIEKVLKENWEISEISTNFQSDTIWFDFLTNPENGPDYVDVNMVIEGPSWETILPLSINIENYDEKFSDVNKYEIDNMGVKIDIIVVNPGEEMFEDLTQENIWKVLFNNKVPEKHSQ
jgi:hypothetical protein